MVQIIKRPVIKRGNVTTVTGNNGTTPTTKRVPGTPVRPQPIKKGHF